MRGNRPTRIAVLLSIGVHPLTLRARRACADAAAVDAALRSGCARVVGWHAGNPDDPVLRQYLGMGLEEIRVIPTDHEADASELLMEAVTADAPQLLMCGERAEGANASGFLPYLLAHKLGYPIVSSVCEFALQGTAVSAKQKLPAGARRVVSVSTPAILAFSAPGMPPRFSAYGRMRRGRMTRVELTGPARGRVSLMRASPAKRVPKRLAGDDVALSPEERLRRITGDVAAASPVRQGLSAQAVAALILADLRAHGLALPTDAVRTTQLRKDDSRRPSP
jgi:electron transfer flavoprotein beta subunit